MSNTHVADGMPLTAPVHTFFTSPTRSHPDATHAKELPLHLVHLILTYVSMHMYAIRASKEPIR